MFTVVNYMLTSLKSSYIVNGLSACGRRPPSARLGRSGLRPSCFASLPRAFASCLRRSSCVSLSWQVSPTSRSCVFLFSSSVSVAPASYTTHTLPRTHTRTNHSLTHTRTHAPTHALNTSKPPVPPTPTGSFANLEPSFFSRRFLLPRRLLFLLQRHWLPHSSLLPLVHRPLLHKSMHSRPAYGTSTGQSFYGVSLTSTRCELSLFLTKFSLPKLVLNLDLS